MGRWEGEGCCAGLAISVLFSDLKPIHLMAEGFFFFVVIAVFLLYCGFAALFPLDHNPRSLSLCAISPRHRDNSLHKAFHPVANVSNSLCFSVLFWNSFVLRRRPELYHCSNRLHCSVSGRLRSPFPAIRQLGMYLQWHGGSNWHDS